MYRGQSRTHSRAESLKRRQLEARHLPSMQSVQHGGAHTYSVKRPKGGRERLSPLPARTAVGTGQLPREQPGFEPVLEPMQAQDLAQYLAQPAPEPVREIDQFYRPAETRPAETDLDAARTETDLDAARTETDLDAATTEDYLELVITWPEADAPVGLARRRLSLGWWVALASASTFFLASIATWLFSY